MRKEQFNIAYIRAIAAQAGINHATPTVDDDSVDLTLIGKGYAGIWRSPEIQFQLKCTAQNIKRGNELKFPLSRKNYDDLRGDDVLAPRYLVVLMVPELCDDWISHQFGRMLIRNECYWLSIRNHPDVNTDTVTVSIPISQRLTTDKLKEMLALASDGKSL